MNSSSSKVVVLRRRFPKGIIVDVMSNLSSASNSSQLKSYEDLSLLNPSRPDEVAVNSGGANMAPLLGQVSTEWQLNSITQEAATTIIIRAMLLEYVTAKGVSKYCLA